MSTPFCLIAGNPVRVQSGAVLATRISENIRRLREERGLSRPQLGLRLNPPTSGQQIEKLEKGERRLTVEWVERLARAMDIDPAELLAGQGQSFSLTESVAREVAQALAIVARQGETPPQAIVEDLALLVQALSETFAKHPQSRYDPEVARPVVDLLAHRFARQS